MNKQAIKIISLSSTLFAIGLSANTVNADSFEFAGNTFTVNAQQSQRVVTDRFEFAGNKYVISKAKSGHAGADLAALELSDADNDLIYGDDDIDIVLTGAH